jgi:hypothetical protein
MWTEEERECTTLRVSEEPCTESEELHPTEIQAASFESTPPNERADNYPFLPCP